MFDNLLSVVLWEGVMRHPIYRSHTAVIWHVICSLEAAHCLECQAEIGGVFFKDFGQLLLCLLQHSINGFLIARRQCGRSRGRRVRGRNSEAPAYQQITIKIYHQHHLFSHDFWQIKMRYHASFHSLIHHCACHKVSCS